MAQETDAWSVAEEQRAATRQRVASNLINMAFAEGASISDTDATATARAIEKKAYTVALAEAQTTTGVRPHRETQGAYTRYT